MPWHWVEAPLPPKFFAQRVAPSAAASFNAMASWVPIFASTGVVRLGPM